MGDKCIQVMDHLGSLELGRNSKIHPDILREVHKVNRILHHHITLAMLHHTTGLQTTHPLTQAHLITCADRHQDLVTTRQGFRKEDLTDIHDFL